MNSTDFCELPPLSPSGEEVKEKGGVTSHVGRKTSDSSQTFTVVKNGLHPR